MPTEVSDEIVLIHPAVPPMVGFKENAFFFHRTLAANGAVEVVAPLVPTDRYWWIQFLDIQHNDLTNRVLRILVRDTVPNEVIIQTSGAAADSETRTFDRPLILSNDTQLVGQVPAIDAGARLRIRFYYLELLHAELNPQA